MKTLACITTASLGFSGAAAEPETGDFDGDGVADVADAKLVLNYYVRNMLAKTPTTWEQILNPQK